MKAIAIINRLAIFAMLAALLLLAAYKLFAPGQDSSVTAQWMAHQPNAQTTVSHRLWQDVLDEYLITDDPSEIALFDYQGYLDDDSGLIQAYIQELSGVDPRTLSRDEQYAFWVNLYNALTVKVVLADYPVESIKEIGESALPTGPWNDVVIQLAGQDLTLNHIEHSILRPIWNDYRIHFAVNCASIGCPNLQAQAFTADNMDTLLNQAAEQFLNHPRGIQLDDEHLQLSSLFNWYAEDFGDSEAQVIELLSKHLDPELAQELDEFSGDISYQYDWQLNGLEAD